VIYLDNATALPSDDAVSLKMIKALNQDKPISKWAQNPKKGPSLKELYTFVGAHPDDIFIFTSSGAEAINHVMLGTYLAYTRPTGKHHFLCSALASTAAILSAMRLESFGALTQKMSVNNRGFVDQEAFISALSPRTVLASLPCACPLTGVIQPLDEIAKLCQLRGVLLHIDGSALLGRGYFSFEESQASFLTLDGPAIGAPAGTGALFIKRGVELEPLIVAESGQMDLRAGAINEGLLEGFLEAARIAHEGVDAFCMQSAQQREYIENSLKGYLEPLFTSELRLPHVLALKANGVTAEALAYHLYKQKIIVSQGGGPYQTIGHVLRHCQLDALSCVSTLSIGLGPQNSQEQVDIMIEKTKSALAVLGRLSEAL
jgi:cysteine desulfurase